LPATAVAVTEADLGRRRTVIHRTLAGLGAARFARDGARDQANPRADGSAIARETVPTIRAGKAADQRAQGCAPQRFGIEQLSLCRKQHRAADQGQKYLFHGCCKFDA